MLSKDLLIDPYSRFKFEGLGKKGNLGTLSIRKSLFLSQLCLPNLKVFLTGPDVQGYVQYLLKAVMITGTFDCDVFASSDWVS